MRDNYSSRYLRRQRASTSVMTKIGFALGVICLVCALSAVVPALVTLSWNYVAPVFWPAAPVLTFWVSFVIVFLLGIVGRLFRH